MKPTEGTILTVFRMMSEQIEKNRDEIRDLEMLFREAVKSANDALILTPEMLPKLKQAGVVDSGGKGIVYILEGMADYYLTGKMPELNGNTFTEPQKDVTSPDYHTEDVKFSYCTEFIILNPAQKKNELTKRYENLGDSIVVVADEDIIKVHIHTNSPGIVISEALKIGQLVDIKIDNMKEQNKNLPGKVKPAERQPYSFVAVASGEGFRGIYKELGINHTVTGGQSMNPSADDILNAANNANADVVYVFPNNKNIILAANQAAQIFDGKMVVIPTQNMSDVLSCMVAFSENADAEENLAAMSEILAGLKSVQITYAVRDSVFDNAEIKEGEIMCMFSGSIAAKGKDINKTAVAALNKLNDGDISMVTVYAGADINGDRAAEFEKLLNKKFPGIDFAFYRGDQPVYYYLITLE
jgi:DAK2 domain fusion protein YloV